MKKISLHQGYNVKIRKKVKLDHAHNFQPQCLNKKD